MKVLDVDLFQEGLQRNIIMIDRLSSEMEAINDAVKGLVQMEDQLKGAGGNAIRSFYQECHLPLLYFFQSFSEQFKQVLSQMEAALHSLEPDSSGYILETFLDGELEQGLTLIGKITARLTDEANSIMDQVSDIVALPHLDDSGVQEGVISSKRKRDDTLNQLYEFDATQTYALNPIEQGLQMMDTWLTEIYGLFQSGVKDINFLPSQWNVLTFRSEIRTALFPKIYLNPNDLWIKEQEQLMGTEITPGTFRALEGKKTKTIKRGTYGSFTLLKFHLYENGLIVKEYQLGTRKPIQYEVVNKVEEEFDDGGFRELDGYFEGTKLAFVDYLRPHAIVKKGVKLAFSSGSKLFKYKGDLSVKKTPTVENKSPKYSVNGSQEAGNPNNGMVKDVPSYGKNSVPIGPYREVNGFPVKVKPGAQEKHIPNTPNFKQEIANGKNKSIFYGDNKTAQELLDKFAGKGQLLPNGKKERVDFGKTIGNYYDRNTGEYLDTTNGLIHYGKDGAHIVPSRP
ncbi:T7SS effector LXG polymorphic toxin [Psychrobacillus sp. FSL K6-4046]|uniref:T7SS effector LXG polymorphic toxin n=1 Tax=Psychrobacillus sp. FSL K6-4046 TaxID=2921550 RepID=UPI0031599DAB